MINLNGRWTAGGTQSAVISQSSASLTINMSAFNRPTAHGFILADSTIRVTFPDDKTYTGKLEQPGKIRWSNASVWKRVIDMVQKLEGFWIPEGGPESPRAKISVKSSSITIDMSGFGRPTAHGDIISDSLITVIFPDDFGRTWNGVVEERNKIRWSIGGLVWTKFFPEG